MQCGKLHGALHRALHRARNGLQQCVRNRILRRNTGNILDSDRISPWGRGGSRIVARDGDRIHGAFWFESTCGLWTALTCTFWTASRRALRLASGT